MYYVERNNKRYIFNLNICLPCPLSIRYLTNDTVDLYDCVRYTYITIYNVCVCVIACHLLWDMGSIWSCYEAKVNFFCLLDQAVFFVFICVVSSNSRCVAKNKSRKKNKTSASIWNLIPIHFHLMGFAFNEASAWWWQRRQCQRLARQRHRK